MTRIVCLLGSPTANGSSDQLAERFCETARKAGADVCTHALRDLRYQGYMPPTSGLYENAKDDLDPILTDIASADVLVLATPIYFCDMTGLMKLAFDRFETFLKQDADGGGRYSELGDSKTLVIIQVQGNDASHHSDFMAHYKPAFDALGFSYQTCLRACTIEDPRDLKAAPHLFEATDKLVEDIIRHEFA